jgi:hypothetical protein
VGDDDEGDDDEGDDDEGESELERELFDSRELAGVD